VRLLAPLALLASCLGGCISAVPTVPVTPANSAQVSGCQSIAATHNDLVVAGFVLSGGATGLGAVAALDTNAGARTALAVSAAIVGAATAAATGWTALTSSEFANGQCSAVVGPLPASGKRVTWQLDPVSQ
jgi:hypothetical protein